MKNDQTQDSMILTAVLSVACGLVAFGIALAVGGWDYTPAGGVGVGVAAVVGIFLVVALHRPDRNP